MGVIPRFSAVLANDGLDIHGLTTEQTEAKWAEYDQLVWLRVQELRNDRNFPGSPGQLNQILAELIIETHLGTEWVERNILRPKSADSSGSYLSYGSHSLYTALSRHRVQELGRRLYQMQSYPWFDTVIGAVRTRDLSGVAFELDVLWALQTVSPYVEARRETGVKGGDYDAFALMGQHLVPIEVKAKDDATPWSSKSVINTVKSAAGQLPKGDVGLLFLRIPTTWVGPALEDGFSDALTEGTRQTRRIGAILTAIDKVHITTSRTATVERFFDYFATLECPEHIQSFCVRFRQFWEEGLNQLAPRQPF